LKEDEIIDVLDAIISLPRRDVLFNIIRSERPITSLEISKGLNLSLSEVLDHLQVLHRVGLVDIEKIESRSVWFFTKPFELEVQISNKGIFFRESEPNLWKKIKNFLKKFFI